MKLLILSFVSVFFGVSVCAQMKFKLETALPPSALGFSPVSSSSFAHANCFDYRSFSFFSSSALTDAIEEPLKIKKRKYIFKNEPAKPIWKGLNYSPDFKNLIKSNSEAEAAFNKSRYFSYANLAGRCVLIILLIKDLIGIKQSDGGFKASSLVPYVVTAGFTIGTGITANKNFNKGVKLFNQSF